MFKVELPTESIRRRANDAQREMTSGREELLHSVGARLVRLAKESFLVRSRGGTSVGIQWKTLSEARDKAKRRKGQPDEIGIASGKLLESAQYTIDSEGVSVDFHASYAFAFEELRPLLPEQLPKDWQDELEDLVLDWSEDILVKNFEVADF